MNNDTIRAFIQGRSNSGKSVFAANWHLLINFSGTNAYSVVVDVKDWLYKNNDRYMIALKDMGYKIIRVTKDVSWQTIPWMDVIKGAGKIVIVSEGVMAQERIAFGDVLAHALYDLGNVNILWDEMPKFIQPYKSASSGIELLYTGGRKENINIIGVAQHALNMVPTTLRREFNNVIMYQQFDEAEINEARQYFGDDAVRLRDLPDYTGLWWNFYDPKKLIQFKNEDFMRAWIEKFNFGGAV